MEVEITPTPDVSDHKPNVGAVSKYTIDSRINGSKNVWIGTRSIIRDKIPHKCKVIIKREYPDKKLSCMSIHTETTTMKHIGSNKWYAPLIEFEHTPVPQMIIEYQSGMQLHDYICQKNILSEVECIQLLKHLVKSVNHLYSKGYVDVDISIENIIISKVHNHMTIKQIDMGLCIPIINIESFLDECRSKKLNPYKSYCVPPEIYNYNTVYNWDILQTMVYTIGLIMFITMSNGCSYHRHNDYWYMYFHSNQWIYDVLSSDFKHLHVYIRQYLRGLRVYTNSLLSLINAMVQPLQDRISWKHLTNHVLVLDD
jgi:serine/threonine protein kinase